MKKEFPGFFANHGGDMERLWEDSLFVLDANVLLSLYRYSDATRAELLQVFRSLGNRLWVPHQVVYEYLINRLKVIGEQAKVYEDSIKSVELIRKGLENNNHHPFVSANTLVESASVFEKLLGELSDNKSVHEGRISSDEIKEQLISLLEGKVGGGFDRTRLELILKDGASRYEQKIPPGYKDIKKAGDTVVFTEMCKPFGDYIVWLQVIEKAQLSKKPVIFVTGDNKEDWWLTFQGKTIGPQPQLVEEFLQETSQQFYMYPPDRFLERANAFLKQETSQEAMNEIRNLRDEGDEPSLADAALFDSAVNEVWPVAKKGLDAFGLALSDEYTRENFRLHEQMSAVQKQIEEAEHRLEFEFKRYKKYEFDCECLKDGTYGVPHEAVILQQEQQIEECNKSIVYLEHNLARLKRSFVDLSTAKKDLIGKHFYGRS